MRQARLLSAVAVYSALGLCTLGFFGRCGRQDTAVTGKPATPSPAPQPVASDWDQYQGTLQPFLTKNCISCHSGDMPEAGVRLEAFTDSAEMEKKGHVLTGALRMIRQHKMPPSDQPQPTPQELKPVVAWLDNFALKVDAEDLKNPGHVTMRRLNRAEYSATVRDLLGVDFNAGEGFPEDDSGFGFDNNGDILSLAPVLMDKYLVAAEHCLDEAILVKPSDPVVQSWDAGQLEGTPPKVTTAPATQAAPGRGNPAPRGRLFAYNGDISVEQTFAKTGHYVLRLRAYGTAATTPGAAPGGGFGGRAGAAAGGVAGAGAAGGAGAGAGGAGFGGRGGGRGAPAVRPSVVFKVDGKEIDKPVSVMADFQQPTEFGIQTPVLIEAGKHVITLTFVNGASKQEYDTAVAAAAAAAATAPATATAPAAGGRGGFGGGGFGRGGRGGPPPSPTGKPTLGVLALEAVGPVDPTMDRMPESYRKIFVARPSESLSRSDAAQKVISTFISRAFRRPATEAEVKRLMAYWSSVEKDETFEKSISLALQPVLVSPHFLYRVEGEPGKNDPDGVRTLSEYELASRLSYFLWSSMPDDELMRLAGEGKLRANLPEQIKRMLASPKSSGLAENFGGQWLQLRKIPGDIPDAKKFPEFDEELRTAMVKETNMFFEAVIHEDRSVLDFLDSDFTFVNAKLAKFYGIPNVTGDEFRRVSLAGTPRGGLITQASVLTLTSYPDRTSPVLRGKWVLENLLDAAPPPPPPNVPTLEASTKDKSKLPLRQRMEAHRVDPNCISCHTVMDPIGFGLENFNAIGAFRTADPDANNEKIDASGKFPDGQAFDGPSELRKILMGRKDEFVECLVERMLTYALGRGLDVQDRPRVTAIAEAVKKDNYKFSTLVMQIIANDAFQKQGSKRGDK